jgi:hypothetical protein
MPKPILAAIAFAAPSGITECANHLPEGTAVTANLNVPAGARGSVYTLHAGAHNMVSSS